MKTEEYVSTLYNFVTDRGASKVSIIVYLFG